MKAMILAAGRGERMRPLTDTIPKPLIDVGGMPLVAHHLLALAKNGIRDVVINVFHLAEQIQAALGDGDRYGVKIQYSVETTLLETGGGIVHALPLLGVQPFIVINGDILTDYPLHQLQHAMTGLAHVVLVDNPPHHLKGDYSLNAMQQLSREGESKLTFAGIGLYHPLLFKNYESGAFRLPTVIDAAIVHGQVTGEHYQGKWIDVGTVERLEEARKLF